MSADIHSLVGAYAVDAVDEAERAAFELHLAECAECRAEVASLRAVTDDLSLLAEAAPPASLKQSVLAGIATIRPEPPVVRPTAAESELRSEPTPEPTPGSTAGATPDATTEPTGRQASEATVVRLSSWRRKPTTWLAAAAAAVAIAVGGLVWSPWSGQDQQLSQTQQVVAAKDAQRFEKTVDGARATIVRSPSLGKAVLIADNMPSAPDGKDFQLWLQRPDGSMVSAGLMPHGHSDTVTVMLEGDATTATGAGITLEPAGGSTQPTSNPVALFAFT